VEDPIFDLRVEKIVPSNPAATGIEFSGQKIQTFEREKQKQNKKSSFAKNANLINEQVKTIKMQVRLGYA
jgi:hypothetical protein